MVELHQAPFQSWQIQGTLIPGIKLRPQGAHPGFPLFLRLFLHVRTGLYLGCMANSCLQQGDGWYRGCVGICKDCAESTKGPVSVVVKLRPAQPALAGKTARNKGVVGVVFCSWALKRRLAGSDVKILASAPPLLAQFGVTALDSVDWKA